MDFKKNKIVKICKKTNRRVLAAFGVNNNINTEYMARIRAYWQKGDAEPLRERGIIRARYDIRVAKGYKLDRRYFKMTAFGFPIGNAVGVTAALGLASSHPISSFLLSIGGFAAGTVIAASGNRLRRRNARDMMKDNLEYPGKVNAPILDAIEKHRNMAVDAR